VEAMMVLLVTLILAAVAIPEVQGTIRNYRINAAATAASSAIQSTRFQCIMLGYPFQIAFNQANASYQILSMPPGAASFSNVGGPVPISSGTGISLSPSTTLQFSPGGTVRVVDGSMNFTVTDGILSKTITTSGVGNVTISQ
jgi:Tfp pilus assembly protein FimT